MKNLLTYLIALIGLCSLVLGFEDADGSDVFVVDIERIAEIDTDDDSQHGDQHDNQHGEQHGDQYGGQHGSPPA